MNSEEALLPEIIHVKEVESTNKTLRSFLDERKLPEGSLVWADFQTGGRGQLGNTWESEKGKNLTFSVVLYPEMIPANKQFLISQIAALSVKDTLDQFTGEVSIKWPNDVYWKDRKICGMLIENDLTGPFIYCSLLGIGINLNQETFVSTAPNPVSLLQITGRTYDRKEVLDLFIRNFYNNYLLLLQEEYEEIRARYRLSLYHGEGYHLYQDEQGTFEACVTDIEPAGHLLLTDTNGQERRYAFKEVSFLNR